MSDTPPIALELLKALRFAAIRHIPQHRKGPGEIPYINHPIEVAELLSRVAAVDDLVVLQAALLHDTVEDTETTGEEIESIFGAEVRGVVEEVTDDKSLPKGERKRLQVEHAPHLSPRAKLVKLADKTSNVRESVENPPSDWSVERQRDYILWAKQVVTELGDVNTELRQMFERAADEGLKKLGSS